MDSWMIALLIKPFAVLVFMAIGLCLRFSMSKWMPEGWLKNLLLKRLWGWRDEYMR